MRMTGSKYSHISAWKYGSPKKYIALFEYFLYRVTCFDTLYKYKMNAQRNVEQCSTYISNGTICLTLLLQTN